MLRMKVRRYRLWWSGKGDGVGGVGVMVKEELCAKVLEVPSQITDYHHRFCYRQLVM